MTNQNIDPQNCLSDGDKDCPFVPTGSGEITKEEIAGAMDEAENALKMAEGIVEDGSLDEKEKDESPFVVKQELH